MCSSINTEDTLPYTEDIKLGDLHPDGSQLRPYIVWFGEMVPMLSTAEVVCYDADIFILCGTSLQVYPAAGLIHRLHTDIPKYVVDVDIPEVPSSFIKIEAKATQGIPSLVANLMAE